MLTHEVFDLLIVGGGITGAGVALDAATRGLKTALVEKGDFASGTSSKSTKLVHGGLRYLKQLEFGLVKEVGSERAVVHRLAPHLVVPEKMLLPLSEGRGLGYWLTSIGLKIYDWLAGVSKRDQRRMLTRAQTMRREPLLGRAGLKGGAIYAEYRTDDARLTIEVIKTAARHGATILNYCDVTDFEYADGKVCGVRVRENLTQEVFTIHARCVVSAAGPWVDELRALDKSRTGKRLHLTKGVHIVVPQEKLPVRQAIYFDVDDGRMIFAIPRGRTTYVGTTDTNYAGNKDHVVTTTADAAYLINAVNAMFPRIHLTLNDIESSWAGLRPLIHEEGKSASELSRKDEIFESPSGLLSIAGGKLTGYRKMAERVVDRVITQHFREFSDTASQTATVRITQNPFRNFDEVLAYIHKVESELVPFGFTSHMAHYLVKNYGSQTRQVIHHSSKYKTANIKSWPCSTPSCSFVLKKRWSAHWRIL
ncbi:MAG: glycerol-3-phosphate dehydrogenase/oxidase [Bacteroidia bacterium]|nr:glycerol-3-phosphate dehydrogenase/oxidase [Bacteroidia bacterium]